MITSGRICLFCLSLLTACDGGVDPVAPDSGEDFYPLQVGRYAIFSVDSSYYRQNVLFPVSYFLKTKISQVSPNADGGQTYTFTLLKRASSSLPWNNLATYSARISGTKVIVSEGNTSYVKLLLPLTEGLEWNGNEFNNRGGSDVCGSNKDEPCDVYATANVGMRYTASAALDFENTVTINQQDLVDNITGDDVRKEIYARGVGLVYKESRILVYCTDTRLGCVGKKIIDRGVNYKQIIVEYGLE